MQKLPHVNPPITAKKTKTPYNVDPMVSPPVFLWFYKFSIKKAIASSEGFTVKAKKALKEAIAKYEGALILVSHEEDFALDLCDSVTLLRD